MVLSARVDVRAHQPQGALGQCARAGQRVDLLLVRRQGGRDLQVIDPGQGVQEPVVDLVWWKLDRTGGRLCVSRILRQCGARGRDSGGRPYGRDELTPVHENPPSRLGSLDMTIAKGVRRQGSGSRRSRALHPDGVRSLRAGRPGRVSSAGLGAILGRGALVARSAGVRTSGSVPGCCRPAERRMCRVRAGAPVTGRPVELSVVGGPGRRVGGRDRVVGGIVRGLLSVAPENVTPVEPWLADTAVSRETRVAFSGGYGEEARDSAWAGVATARYSGRSCVGSVSAPRTRRLSSAGRATHS